MQPEREAGPGVGTTVSNLPDKQSITEGVTLSARGHPAVLWASKGGCRPHLILLGISVGPDGPPRGLKTAKNE